MADGRPDPFGRDVARMLLVFFAVAVIDVVALSLLTGQLRLWFPMWLDPAWQTNPDAWVVYSQSYIAGIAFIPFVVYIVDRDFLGGGPAALRAILWIISVGTLAFIGWWKGGLMVEHGKELEAVGWICLTAILFALVCAAESLPERAARIGRRALLRGLMLGVAVFFLGMAVLDPVMQIAVQQTSWSTGLLIEVGFFVPAGLALLLLSRRLKSQVRP